MKKKEQTAVVLMSGGMDSTVCVAIATQMGFSVAGMHLNYGQTTETRELKSFHDICDFYNIKRRLVIDSRHLALIGGSSLTDLTIEVSSADLANKEIPTSYVPFRNANILAMATSWAEVLVASALFVGAVEEDSSGYPDCCQEFFDAFQKVIDTGTKPETHINIFTPIIRLSKKEIVLKGVELGAPLNLTWSCYQNNEIACGQCDSCALRLRGFQQANVEDKIPYRTKPKYI